MNWLNYSLKFHQGYETKLTSLKPESYCLNIILEDNDLCQIYVRGFDAR